MTVARPQVASGTEDLPLCVDLDGTLVKVDTLHEGFLRLLRAPSRIPGALLSLLRGRAAFKAYLGGDAAAGAGQLPYRDDLVDWLHQERRRGRGIYLVTAADQRVADAVAGHLGLFEAAIGSDGARNLKGTAKGEYLASRFGDRQFVYAGDARADLAVWRRAAGAVTVGTSPGVTQAAAEMVPVERAFGKSGRGPAAALLRALRPAQWAKNLLVFVPVTTARALDDAAGWLASLTIFGAFCALASAGYLINDLADVDSDRVHPTKRHRPIAAGDLPSAQAVAAAAMLFLLGAALAWRAGP